MTMTRLAPRSLKKSAIFIVKPVPNLHFMAASFPVTNFSSRYSPRSSTNRQIFNANFCAPRPACCHSSHLTPAPKHTTARARPESRWRSARKKRKSGGGIRGARSPAWM
jgi:hypothetical protein